MQFRYVSWLLAEQGIVYNSKHGEEGETDHRM